MLSTLARCWWMPLTRGILHLLFAGCVAFLPGLAFSTGALIYAVFCLLDGGIALIMSMRAAPPAPRYVLALEGVVGLGVGVLLLALPYVSPFGLLYLIALRALNTGVLEVAEAASLKGLLDRVWPLGLGGLVALAFGVIVLAEPVRGAYAHGRPIAIYAAVVGAAFVAFGVHLRHVAQRTGDLSSAPRSA